MKSTPGPWKVYDEYNVMKDNRSIANCGGHTVSTSNWQEVEEENKANAQLIAAAPALLAAAHTALIEMVAMGNRANWDAQTQEYVDAINGLRAAIAETRKQAS